MPAATADSRSGQRFAINPSTTMVTREVNHPTSRAAALTPANGVLLSFMRAAFLCSCTHWILMDGWIYGWSAVVLEWIETRD